MLRTSSARLVVVAALMGSVSFAQEGPQSRNLYGEPGLIDMPTADSARDAQIGATLGVYDDQQRTSFVFQVTPRLSGTFRYSHIDRYGPGGLSDLYDRSFDLRYRLVDETEILPNISIGLRDFMGKGIYSGEYLVATKGVTDNIRVTAGLGWGRLASRGGFDNPLGIISDTFDTRPALDPSRSGVPLTDQFFRGDAALFGGVEWQLNDKWSVKAEYSSDAYVSETATGVYSPKSAVNVGLTWRPRPEYELSGYYLNGTDIGLSGTILLNPLDSIAPSGLEPAPIPVKVRAEDLRAAQSWDKTILPASTLVTAVSGVLAGEGVVVSGMDLQDQSVRVRYTNTRYRSETEAAGRIARILTQAMPPSVETFVLEPMQGGVPMSAITLRRTDIEDLENTGGAAAAIAARATVTPAGPNAGLEAPETERAKFTWGLSPDLNLELSDSSEPLRADLGLELKARYEIQPNLVLAGSLRGSLWNNYEPGVTMPGPLPPVRRDSGLYATEGNPGLQYLTLAHYGHLGGDLYSRITVGYLETMFGGVSTELLWKPQDSRLALGAELNYAQQRDYDMGLGFQDYSIVTGHASAYYDFDNGFTGQVDLGRYLAGDWGATFAMDRAFRNGWKIGGYFTLTDVSFDDFGEGSFDKGVRVTIPFDWFTGKPTRNTMSTTITSLTRDGGARLNVQGRLYDTISGGQSNAFGDEWGRFWR